MCVVGARCNLVLVTTKQENCKDAGTCKGDYEGHQIDSEEPYLLSASLPALTLQPSSHYPFMLPIPPKSKNGYARTDESRACPLPPYAKVEKLNFLLGGAGLMAYTSVRECCYLTSSTGTTNCSKFFQK